MEGSLKAIIQQYHNRMIDNRLTPEEPTQSPDRVRTGRGGVRGRADVG